jgi:hypothetical protein
MGKISMTAEASQIGLPSTRNNLLNVSTKFQKIPMNNSAHNQHRLSCSHCCATCFSDISTIFRSTTSNTGKKNACTFVPLPHTHARVPTYAPTHTCTQDSALECFHRADAGSVPNILELHAAAKFSVRVKVCSLSKCSSKYSFGPVDPWWERCGQIPCRGQ